MNDQNKSEVAFLMAQFEAERQSAQWALTGIASNVSKHEFITARMERMGQIQGQLAPLIGEEEAVRLVVEAMGLNFSQGMANAEMREVSSETCHEAMGKINPKGENNVQK